MCVKIMRRSTGIITDRFRGSANVGIGFIHVDNKRALDHVHTRGGGPRTDM